MRMASLAVAALLLAGAAHAADAPGERLVNLPLSDSLYDYQRLLVAGPPKPKAVIVMLPGGSGRVSLARDGSYRSDKNFLVRTRALWTARGYAVVIPDTVDNLNLGRFRTLSQYGALVGSLIAYAHHEFGAPVFLMGASQGSVAAMNAAAQAPRGTLAGLILAESAPEMGPATVFSADPEKVRVPALVVANRDDRCQASPAYLSQRIAAAMSASPEVKVATISGGVTSSLGDCSPLTPHGYYGVEDQVVGLVGDWIDAHTG